VKILISESAFTDLEDIKDYYKAQGVADIGNNFIKEIFTHIESLKTHPKIGRMVSEFNQSLIREIIHPPFRVVYIIEQKSIQIIRVWRSERLLKMPENQHE
jgi:plasmid stabilization system protein ParE